MKLAMRMIFGLAAGLGFTCGRFGGRAVSCVVQQLY